MAPFALIGLLLALPITAIAGTVTCDAWAVPQINAVAVVARVALARLPPALGAAAVSRPSPSLAAAVMAFGLTAAVLAVRLDSDAHVRGRRLEPAGGRGGLERALIHRLTLPRANACSPEGSRATVTA